MNESRSRKFTVVNAVVAGLFLLSAALQLNDPDPAGWIVLYGAAAFACASFRRGRAGWLLPLAVLIAAAVWAGLLAPRVLPELRFGHLLRSMKAETPAIELGRELLGLGIVAAWMAVLLLARAWPARSRID